MKSITEWLAEHHKSAAAEKADHAKLKKDSQGGIVPQDMTIAKRVDLITLPVSGTNCGNCKYIDKEGDIGFCNHPEVKQYVNAKMCCSLWDHDKVKRQWK